MNLNFLYPRQKDQPGKLGSKAGMGSKKGCLH